MTTPTVAKLAEKLARTIHEDVASPQGEGARPPADLQLAARHADRQRRPRHGPAVLRLRRGPSPRGPAGDARAPAGAARRARGRAQAPRGADLRRVPGDRRHRPDAAQLMRAVFQEQPEVAHVYLGSKRHMMRRLFSDENEPFWRSAKPVELGVIAPEAFAAYIVERFSRQRPRHRPRHRRRGPADDAGAPVRDAGALLLPVAADAGGRGRRPGPHAGRAEGVLRSENAHFATVWDHASRSSGCCCRRWPPSPAMRWPPTTAAATTCRRPRRCRARDRARAQELVPTARRRAHRRAVPRGVGARGSAARRRPRAPQSSSSPLSSSPARRITIWFSSIVTLTGRWPAQCSA